MEKSINKITTHFNSKKYSNKSIIVPVNSIYKNIYYIRKGVIRIFYYDTNGKDCTHWIGTENDFATIFTSLIGKTTAPYGIEVIENNSEIYTLPFDKLLSIINQTKELQDFYTQTLIKNLVLMGNRLIDIQTKTSKQRYEEFIKSNPELLQRANLGYIASYLGMSQPQLSKIRSSKY